MDLNEYIRQSYKRPNRRILETLGASEDLIEYLMETPGNTNWNVIGSLGSGGGGDAEVWLVGDNPDEWGQFILSNVGETDHIKELYEHAENYKVFLNGEELTVFKDIREEDYGVEWWDTDGEPTLVVAIGTTPDLTLWGAAANWLDSSTIPASVEVSVQAK